MTQIIISLFSVIQALKPLLSWTVLDGIFIVLNSFKLCVCGRGGFLRENAAHVIVPADFLKQVNIV